MNPSEYRINWHLRYKCNIRKIKENFFIVMQLGNLFFSNGKKPIYCLVNDKNILKMNFYYCTVISFASNKYFVTENIENDYLNIKLNI